MSLNLGWPLSCLILSLLLAPLLAGIIHRVKAVAGGRTGRPLLQLYYDLYKLLYKSPVYSNCSSWIFRAAGPACLSAYLAALLIVPYGDLGSLASFPGDFLVLASFFVLARFAMILAALDTGSAFEGMGAAREALFSALAEPILLFCLMILSYRSGAFTLTGMTAFITPDAWKEHWPFFTLLASSFFLLLLVENCRIPVDDPNTHLELTMIHEVMILDHSGPDLALMEYASALKLWIFALFIANIVVPASGFNAPEMSAMLSNQEGGEALAAAVSEPGIAFVPALADLALALVCVFAVILLVGITESVMARFRMERVPQILTLAGSLVCLAALSLWR